MKVKIGYKANRVIPYVLIILMAIVMLLPQIYNHNFLSGLDYYFHMSRTYETAMQIKTGHFSYFLSIFSWHHNARIVNALYGPIGGYISGLILLIAKSWFNWEIDIFFIMLVLAGGTMYHLCRYWDVKPSIALLIGALYMLSAPITYFIFFQVFTGFAACLVPLIVLMMSELLHDGDIHPIKFALVIVLVVEIHLMTFILSMSFVALCILIGLIVSKHRIRLFVHVFEAAILTVLLSFNEWGSILEVFGSNRHHIIPTFPGHKLGLSPRSSILYKYPKRTLVQTPSIIGLCGFILIVAVIILWIIYLPYLNDVIDVFMLLGIGYVWLSSGLFPWGFAMRHFRPITTLIQFPYRFIPLGLILIYLSLGIILSGLSDKYNFGINLGWLLSTLVLIFFISWTWQFNQETFQHEVHEFYSVKVIHWTNMHRTAIRDPKRLRNSLLIDNPGLFLHMVSNTVPDYVPTSVYYTNAKQYNGVIKPYARYNTYYLQKMQKFHFHWQVPKHGVLNITLNSKDNHMQTIPFTKYAHTQVTLNNRHIKPTINKIGAMKVPLKAGQNRLSLQYQPSLVFKFGMLLSILTWIWLLLYCLYIKFGTKISFI